MVNLIPKGSLCDGITYFFCFIHYEAMFASASLLFRISFSLTGLARYFRFYFSEFSVGLTGLILLFCSQWSDVFIYFICFIFQNFRSALRGLPSFSVRNEVMFSSTSFVLLFRIFGQPYGACPPFLFYFSEFSVSLTGLALLFCLQWSDVFICFITFQNFQSALRGLPSFSVCNEVMFHLLHLFFHNEAMFSSASLLFNLFGQPYPIGTTMWRGLSSIFFTFQFVWSALSHRDHYVAGLIQFHSSFSNEAIFDLLHYFWTTTFLVNNILSSVFILIK